MESKMDTREMIESIDKRLQEQGWNFKGAILHYKNAWMEQATIYEKNGKYVVSGIDSFGEKELNEPISKEDAEERIEEGIKEIRKFMFLGPK